jgi:hypothetical protein
MKTFAIVLGEGWGMREDGGGNLIKAQCKHIQKCHNASPLDKECMLIKML